MANAKPQQDNKAPHGKSGLFKPKVPRQLDDLDFDMLGALPDQGAMKGRYFPDALTMAQLKKKIDVLDLASGFISMRIRDLQDRGLVVPVGPIPGSGGVKGWQRTEEGRKVAMGRLPGAESEAAQA